MIFYLIQLKVQYINQVLLLNYSISSSIQIESIPQNITKAIRILELVIKNKYFISAQLLYAKVKYILGDKKLSMNLVRNVLSIDSKNFEALMLYSFLMIDNNDYHKSKEITNEIMISNMSLTKDNVYFFILKSKCDIGLNEVESAQKNLNEALKLYDKNVNKNNRSNFILNIVFENSIFQVLAKDKLNLLKLNVEILLKLGKTEEAQLLMNKLISDMQDSNLEDDILILNSELALKSGDLKKSVNLLKVIFINIESIN